MKNKRKKILFLIEGRGRVNASNFLLSLTLNLAAAESLPSFDAEVRGVVDEGGELCLLIKGVSMGAKRVFLVTFICLFSFSFICFNV